MQGTVDYNTVHCNSALLGSRLSTRGESVNETVTEAPVGEDSSNLFTDQDNQAMGEEACCLRAHVG